MNVFELPNELLLVLKFFNARFVKGKDTLGRMFVNEISEAKQVKVRNPFLADARPVDIEDICHFSFPSTILISSSVRP